MKKRYLPTNDLLFKRCIGNANHPEITKGFINDLTGIEVSEVQLLNPYDIAWFKSEENNRELSTTIVDVLVSLPDHTQVVVEMQVSKQKYFLERALYYVARHYVDRYGEEA